MKKTLLAVAMSLVAAGAFAQGTISFANSASTLVTTNNGTTSGAAQGANSGRVVLYYSTAVSAPAINTSDLLDLTGWTLTTPTTADSVGVPTVGRFAGGTQTADTATGGNNIWVMVRGWTGGWADWATAVAQANQPGSTTFIGYMTYAFSQGTGAPFGAPPTSPVALATGVGNFNGLVLTPVPEPSTFALAGLGAAALMIFRRRK